MSRTVRDSQTNAQIPDQSTTDHIIQAPHKDTLYYQHQGHTPVDSSPLDNLQD